ncbi:Na(+)/H(+) antiporter subunit [Natrialba magadii ATCC 43099]|uniref:Na(+)/H(+) antiporter subunit n=1 Tax=Natrialba magadii (strain ATCC 43099 / DSM 3394 / CCM 3739 / CIP 104546 / IAM 13178 / JCM 8861 / NBRC 102185 / NCIMB 2190 / MS3) TaxID=547559 RepID=D3SX20_NATMM|nr:hypothetical protein [Natrialba magadii]ADD03840.1 Na(+)/H(+) antiporter subunit [Natrialba magadii ATCC 43099]ELY33500.1 Na(+)/H(+) antiporter subunit [Natrialba magadii ATCC 43099]
MNGRALVGVIILGTITAILFLVLAQVYDLLLLHAPDTTPIDEEEWADTVLSLPGVMLVGLIVATLGVLARMRE